jgi:hypothetical protein
LLDDKDKALLAELVTEFKDGFLEIFADTIGILGEGIKAGKTNIPLGLLAFQNYCDLLHGGAYVTPVDQLTYYTPDVQTAINFGNFTGPFGNFFGLTQGLRIKLANGREIALPAGAKPEQVEIILNSAGGAKYRFPKLLSDQAYYLTKEWISLYMTSGLVTQTATNVSTLVESATGFLAPEKKGVESAAQVAGGGLAALIRSQRAK